jgi:hypothetical protein
MKKIIIAAVAIIFLVVMYQEISRMGMGGLSLLSKPQLINPLPRSSALYVQHQAFIDKINANDKVIAKYASVITSKGLFAIQQDMLRRGAQSLPREQIIAQNKALVAVMVRLPTRTCAKLARPRDDFDKALTMDMLNALEKLPNKHHKAITDFYYDAMVADVENSAIIPINQARYQDAMRDLQYTYHGSSAEKFIRITSNMQTASDEDACWVINTMMNAAEKMPAKNTEALMRHAWAN